MKQPVSVRACDPRATDAEVAAAIFAAADDIGGVGELFRGKRKILIKPNIGTNDMRIHLGRQVALTDPSVLRATVELIRRYFDGHIVIGEATTGHRCVDVYERVGLGWTTSACGWSTSRTGHSASCSCRPGSCSTATSSPKS